MILTKPQHFGFKRFHFVLVFLICFLSPCCQFKLSAYENSYTVEMRQAAAHFEAKQYAQARELYEYLLTQPLEPYQRAVIMYNLGCVWLAAGNYQQAETVFQSVSRDNILKPLLDEYIQKNRMLALMWEGETLAQAKDFTQADRKLQMAIDRVPQLQEAFCNLQKAEGIQVCEESYAAQVVRRTAQHLAIKIATEAQAHGFTRLSPRESAELLLKAAEYGTSQMAWLGAAEMSDSLRDEYERFFEGQLRQSQPLWQSLAVKITADQFPEDVLKLETEAYTQFFNSLRKMNGSQFGLAQKSLQLSAQSLRLLIEALPPPPPSGGGAAEEKEQAPADTAEKNEESQQEEPQQSIDQALQLLLQMEQDDRIPRPMQPLRKSETRPW